MVGVVVRITGLPGPPLPPQAPGVCVGSAEGSHLLHPPPISMWMLGTPEMPGVAWSPGVAQPPHPWEGLLEHNPQASSRWHSGPVGSSATGTGGPTGCVCCT